MAKKKNGSVVNAFTDFTTTVHRQKVFRNAEQLHLLSNEVGRTQQQSSAIVTVKCSDKPRIIDDDEMTYFAIDCCR